MTAHQVKASPASFAPRARRRPASSTAAAAFAATFGLWLLLPGPASGDDAAAPAESAPTQSAPPRAAESAPESSALAAFGRATALSAEELADKRAMANVEIERITINDSDQDGTVTDNVAIGNDTGRNTIGGDAFRGADGFINAVQNTGNNVLIQSATIINVSIEP